MAPLDIPEGGLTLLRTEGSGEPSADSPRNPAQIMRLNLAQSTLDDLIDSLRKDQNARLRLGKHPSLHFGSRSQPFYSYPENTRSELYVSPPDAKDSLYFSGVLSHSLEVQRAREATAGTDEALLTLEQRLSAFRQGKESKRTPMITTDQMRALGAGDNRTATGREAASLARMSTSKADMEKERFFTNTASRSSPASPAFLASRSPAITPTSVPTTQNKDKIRLEALRVPLLHLLAVRPVSVKFLAQKTRSSQEDCLTLVRKYGTENRLNREKYDLKDKAYKDLDVWKFPYPSEDDRQDAIDNAISAFDRMRVSKQDKLWQTLLPKHERGKGKVLSRLNLHTGPPPKSVTPRIHISPSDEPSKEGYGTGNESEPCPNTSSSTPVISKKADASGLKKRPGAITKRAPAPKPKNSTITGKVTKKTDKATEKKAASKPDAKFKSAEFVVDSDEDAEMADSSITQSSKAADAQRSSPDSQPSERSTSIKSPAPAKDKKPSQPKSRPSKTVSSSSTASRPANNRSPQKPSPLGSSPPTNASDIEKTGKSSSTNQSSSSSSPLIHHLPRQRAGSATKVPVLGQPKHAQKAPAVSKPLKRKAEDEENTPRTGARGLPVGLGITHADTRISQHKRRRPSTVSSEESTSGNSTPPMSVTILRQRLREKARQFKHGYEKYRKLHEELSNHASPPESQLIKLQQQHMRLQKMKQEIWDEDRQLRSR
uniref:COM1 protein n=1 Tax=Coccidioides posadasii RMSCC 3488 TaxID=454284 RepID=A0A0J6F6Z8_COCPO|nr:COM1 protein [Coccidioides posadasii RMSCC 3488]